MQKDPDGSLRPWSWGYKFRDGSLRVDIPLQHLHSLFNVTYPIVSQVNPHVHLFHYGNRGTPGRPTAYRQGKGWRGGFLLSAAELILKLNLTTNFKILRDLQLMPKLLGQDWSSVFLQSFHGAVTIWPKSRFRDWPRILTDPDTNEMRRLLFSAQNVTFPKLYMIGNRMRIERAITRGREACRAVREASTEDDPPNIFTQPASPTLDVAGMELSDPEPGMDDSSTPMDMNINYKHPGLATPQHMSWQDPVRLKRRTSSVLETYSPQWYRFVQNRESDLMDWKTPLFTASPEHASLSSHRTSRFPSPGADTPPERQSSPNPFRAP